MTSQQSPEDLWCQLQPDARHALSNLLAEITDHNSSGQRSPQSLFEAYTYAKDITARAIQSRMLMHLPSENQKFRELHAEVQRQMMSRYAESIPENLLKTPYGGKTYERLFSLLQENQAQPVPAAMLRIVTGDDVHTERRARELRELGFDLAWYELDGINVYELRSLDIDLGMIPAIVRNKIRRSKALNQGEKLRILQQAGIPIDG
ncbi:hypothetical protein OG863_21995 [Streptomyces decoyicus]|uniref:DUF5753 domain-containing protein n=1 Tax=Streptomyces decoyicus TaxID=249567 RepID=A0ABZ1FJ04_9ACTN|nr:hypothetical protein [Streptomyces decoyicus]WSB70409.1 hypothetical protein OG863_21995 [Streptomyces decoyicus]